MAQSWDLVSPWVNLTSGQTASICVQFFKINQNHLFYHFADKQLGSGFLHTVIGQTGFMRFLDLSAQSAGGLVARRHTSHFEAGSSALTQTRVFKDSMQIFGQGRRDPQTGQGAFITRRLPLTAHDLRHRGLLAIQISSQHKSVWFSFVPFNDPPKVQAGTHRILPSWQQSGHPHKHT